MVRERSSTGRTLSSSSCRPGVKPAGRVARGFGHDVRPPSSTGGRPSAGPVRGIAARRLACGLGGTVLRWLRTPRPDASAASDFHPASSPHAAGTAARWCRARELVGMTARTSSSTRDGPRARRANFRRAPGLRGVRLTARTSETFSEQQHELDQGTRDRLRARYRPGAPARRVIGQLRSQHQSRAIHEQQSTTRRPAASGTADRAAAAATLTPVDQRLDLPLKRAACGTRRTRCRASADRRPPPCRRRASARRGNAGPAASDDGGGRTARAAARAAQA